MAEPLVLSVDELRAAARLAGVPVPPLVADDDPDDPRVDLAALRGLALRSLVVGLDRADPEAAGGLATTLAALDEPSWLLDVEVDTAAGHPPHPDVRGDGGGGAAGGSSFSPFSPTMGGRAAAAAQHPAGAREPLGRGGERQRWNQAGGARGHVTVTAGGFGFVHVEPGIGLDVERLVEACGLPGLSPTDLMPTPPGGEGADGDSHGAAGGNDDQPPDGFETPRGVHAETDALETSGLGGGDQPPDGFEVATEVHVDADADVLAGDLHTAVTTLVDGGVPAPLAQQWVDAVACRRSASAVRLVRHLDGDTIEVRELRWLVGGDGRVWRVDGGSGHSVNGDDGPVRHDGEDLSRVRLVSARDLRAALADLLTRLPTPAAAAAVRARHADVGLLAQPPAPATHATGRTWHQDGGQPAKPAPSSPPDGTVADRDRRPA